MEHTDLLNEIKSRHYVIAADWMVDEKLGSELTNMSERKRKKLERQCAEALRLNYEHALETRGHDGGSPMEMAIEVYNAACEEVFGNQ